jgi:serine O-acetyltransferase
MISFDLTIGTDVVMIKVQLFLDICRRELKSMYFDGNVYWSKKGDGSFLQSLLYALTCHGWHIMILFRLGKIIYAIPIPVVSHILKFLFRLINFVFSTLYGISINPVCEIGRGFYIGHYGGIFIRGEFGRNCSISQGVTFGSKGAGKSNGWPVASDNLYVGAGAKVIGNITIGNDCIVGANAVVTKSIPENSLAIGVPAVIKSRL